MATGKRLIDADALKERAIRVSTVKEHCYMKAVGTHEIDKAPTVDAVEVVRCKNCGYHRDYDSNSTGKVICKRFNTFRELDFYCAYGERRCDE